MQTSWPTIFRVFLPFAAGYFLSYLFRVVNAVIAPDLVRDIGLNPSDLGLLTSAYFLTFAAFQLPLGVLLDDQPDPGGGRIGGIEWGDEVRGGVRRWVDAGVRAQWVIHDVG